MVEGRSMNRLFRPAIALMNRLKYPQKFALISLLFALPLTLVLVLLISESRQQIASTQQEMQGIVYLRALRGLLERVPQARSLAQEYSRGRASARPALISKQAAIEEHFETLAALDRDLGP